MLATGDLLSLKSWEPTPRQQQAIALLAAGETVSRTAKLVGITERQLYNWRAVPEFRQAVGDALAAVLEQAMAKFVNGVPDAVDVVNRTHKGRGKVDRDRVANAQWAIDRFRHLAEAFGRPADAPQPGLTVSETRSITGSSADLARLIDLIQSDRATKRRLLVESDDLAADDAAADPPSDPGLRPV